MTGCGQRDRSQSRADGRLTAARTILPPGRQCADNHVGSARSACGRQLARVHSGAGRFS